MVFFLLKLNAKMRDKMNAFDMCLSSTPHFHPSGKRSTDNFKRK